MEGGGLGGSAKVKSLNVYNVLLCSWIRILHVIYEFCFCFSSGLHHKVLTTTKLMSLFVKYLCLDFVHVYPETSVLSVQSA